MKNKNIMTVDVKELSRKELENAFENMRELSKQKTKLIYVLCKKENEMKQNYIKELLEMSDDVLEAELENVNLLELREKLESGLEQHAIEVRNVCAEAVLMCPSFDFEIGGMGARIVIDGVVDKNVAHSAVINAKQKG